MKHSAKIFAVDPAANTRGHADPRNYFFERNSRLPRSAFHESLGECIERLGQRAIWPVMVLIAVFIGLGLALNWFA